MITKIQLINWKSFADATLYIDPLTVLIGANSSGKSNILDALEFIRRIASGVGVDAALAGGGELAPLRGGREGATFYGAKQFSIRISLSINKFEYEYFISVAVKKNKAEIMGENLCCLNSDVVLLELVDLGEDGTRNYRILGTGIGQHGLGHNIQHCGLAYFVNFFETQYEEYAEHVSIIRKDSQNLFPFKPVPELMRESSFFSEDLADNGSNVAGFFANREDKKDIEEQLLKFVTELPEGDIVQVWAEAIGLTATKAELYCREAWGDDKEGTIVDANSMSDGTLRFIAILVAVLTMEPGSLIAIEELDNGLHPSRAELLLRGLKELGAERGVDVLAVTHNPALLNALGPEGIPFVSVVHRDASGNSQITLLEDVERLPKLIAGGPLGELVTQGKIQKALQDGEE